MADLKTILEEKKFYHIYNHAVGNDLLFKSDRNYLYFLKQFNKYLENYTQVYAYCLMPNHFHFVLKIKKQVPTNISTDIEYSNKISRQFPYFFNSYAQAYNKENKRMGSLFVNRFKRITVLDENYL